MSHPQLSIRDGVLFYEWGGCPQARFCFVVPSSLRDEVLGWCHDAKTAGHLGQDKTLQRAKKSYFWYNMAGDCRTHVLSCSTCNTNKKPCKKPRADLQSFHAGSPMERLHIDILGPFHPSDSGNVYILVMVDQFTKWIECAPLPDQTAESVARAFLLHFVVTFGCPLTVHADQGRNFESDLFKAMCTALQIAKTRTTPYHPSSNGQVERYNRTLVQMIRCYIEGKHRRWDQDLPLLAMALHSTENRSTGFTPNMMMLGREVHLPSDVVMGVAAPNTNASSPVAWVRQLQQTLSEVHQLARLHLRAAQRYQKRTYDLNLQKRSYNEGDVVYKRNEAFHKGRTRKLESPWTGPYLVVRCRPPLYTIRDRKRDVVHHHDKLKLCQDRAIPLWIRKLRSRFFQEEEAEEIVSPLQAEDLMSVFRLFESSDPPGPDPVTPRPSHAAQEQAGPSVEPPQVTRRGRRIRRPRYLAGYVAD